MFTSLQRRMIGHAALILIVGMLAGLGLLVSLIGGIELIPGQVIDLSIPGDAGAWARTHVGGILNALLVFVVALLISGLGFSEAHGRRIALFMVGTGWANTLFYWAALLTANRALTFGTNRFGPTNFAAIIGLAPALFFVVLSIIAMSMIAKQAWKRD
jgi:hypothetical protein